MKIFGTHEPPAFPFDLKDLREEGKRVITERIALTGVQPKLSLEIEKASAAGGRRRFTITSLSGVWGDFIFKPPSPTYQSLPENEDLVMHLAAIAGLRTAEHTLYRMQSGEFAYVTKRFDREHKRGKRKKLPIEDMCQLTERLAEQKYKGSLEQIGKTIKKYSDNPGLDVIAFFELNLFSFLIGNADMHLKNFSLLTKNGFTGLSPAYDLLSTDLILNDEEETALTLNGKKAKLNRNDWNALGTNLEINSKALENSLARLRSRLPLMDEFIEQSILDPSSKTRLKKLIRSRSKCVLDQEAE